jgi:hypothetical protein
MAQKKNAAAQALNALRNKKLSPERRSELASIAGSGRLKTMTPEERSERARAAVQARWAKAQGATKQS